MTRPRLVVAIPARNEAERIGGCLRALALGGPHPDHIVLALSDCTDRTEAVARTIGATLPVPVLMQHARSRVPAEACAGFARRMAMELAATLAGPDGVILTTDADGRVAPDWLEANLRALDAGADAVMGRAVICPEEAALIPARLHADDALECAYAALLDEIDALLDPDPADPWPRHDEHSGASIAVRVAAYRAAGGMPPLPSAEDRGFHQALRRVDARIRHAPEARVTVSGRLQGRASGGMADTMRRRMVAPDAWLDERLEPAAEAARRSRLRRGARAVWTNGGGMDDVRPGTASVAELALALGMAPGPLAEVLSHTHFGAAWAAIEAHASALRRHRVPVRTLAEQTRMARAIRDALSPGPFIDALTPCAADPADRPVAADAAPCAEMA